MEAPPSSLSSRAKPRDLRCAPRTSQFFHLNPNPQTDVSSRPKRSEVEGPAVPSILITNPNGSAPLPFVIPSEAEGSAVRPSDLPIFPSQPQPPKQTCHPDEA